MVSSFATNNATSMAKRMPGTYWTLAGNYNCNAIEEWCMHSTLVRGALCASRRYTPAVQDHAPSPPAGRHPR